MRLEKKRPHVTAGCGTIKISPGSKALSIGLNFAALQSQWRHLHISEKFLMGRKP
jgi:hypothetical protein